MSFRDIENIFGSFFWKGSSRAVAESWEDVAHREVVSIDAIFAGAQRRTRIDVRKNAAKLCRVGFFFLKDVVHELEIV